MRIQQSSIYHQNCKVKRCFAHPIRQFAIIIQKSIEFIHQS